MNKLCECGCGKELPDPRKRYIHNHHFKNKHHTDQSKKKISTAITGIVRSDETKLKLSIAVKSKEVQEKLKNTNLERSEYDNPFKDRRKIELSWISKLGESNPMFVKEITDNRNRKYKEKTGFNNPFDDPEIQKKGRLTYKEKTGYEFWTQTPEGKIYLSENNWSSTEEGRKFHKQYFIDYGSKNCRWAPNKGKLEKIIFDEVQHYVPYQLLEDQTFLRYFPDRYIKELNIIVELYEPWHKYIWSKVQDDIRKIELIEYTKCEFFVIWQKDWLENKENVLNQFQDLINVQTERLILQKTEDAQHL